MSGRRNLTTKTHSHNQDSQLINMLPMEKEPDSRRAVIDFWKRVNPIQTDSQFPDTNVNELISTIFNPGKFFYLLINFFDLRLEYVHHTIEELLGVKAEGFSTLPDLFKVIHPDDVPQIQLKEEAAGVFYYKRVPNKIPLYKSTYTVRFSDNNGKYKNFLVQNIALTITDSRIHHVLSVFTDVSFMNLLPDNRISFIGINGEPSYYSLSTDPKTILEPQKELTLSDREKDIVRLLAEGLGSKQIADALHISTHTVDTHRRNLLKKTGTKNTLELAVVCLKQGLI